MAFSTGETATLIALLKLNDQFSGPLKSAQRTMGQFDAKLSATSTRAFRAGQQIGTGIQNGIRIAAVALASLGGLLLESAREGQAAAKVQNIYATAIANSGRVSAAQVAVLNAQQKALLELAGVDDELIKAEQTRLIQMGLTGDQVARLTPLILDVAKATGRDLLTVTLAVGKAAEGNNTALQRLGIIIPKNKDKTKAYADTVKVLNDRFGGTTKALSGGLDVRLAVLREKLANVREEAGLKLLPVMTRIVDVVGSKLVPAFGEFIDHILPTAIAGLNQLADFLGSGGATSAIDGFLKTARDLMPAIESGARITGQVISTAVNLFKSLPPEIQALAVAGLAVNKLTGGLVTNIAGGLISAVISSFRGLMNVNAAVVNVNGPVVGAGLPGIVPDAAGGAMAAVGGLTATAAAALVVAPLAIAAVGLALGKANDPTGEKTLAARAQTATARGIPDWNNKALQELKAIHAANADAASGTANDPIHTSSTDQQPGKALDDMTSALKTYLRMLNASQKLTPAQAEAIRAADRVARHAPGIGPFKKSDITPRLSFLAASHPGKQDVKVAAALVLGFETGEGGAAFRSTKDLKRTIEALQKDQKQLLQHGDTVAAGIIGKDIARLNGELKRRTDAAAEKTARAATIAGQVAAQATREKNLSVTLTNNTIINGRLFDATISRWTPARAAHGFRP